VSVTQKRTTLQKITKKRRPHGMFSTKQKKSDCPEIYSVL